MTEPRAGAVDEGPLVRAIAAGSQDALAALYDRHAEAIYALALRMSDDRGIAEEVVQETFLVLWNRAERFDPGTASLGTWLRSIARNRTIDRLRAAGRRPRLVPIGPDDADGPDGDALDRVVASGTIVGGSVVPVDPEDRIEQIEVREAIRAALAIIPDDERTVILLAYQAELTQTEIADRLGWPLGTVKTRTRRALRRLRDTLGGPLGGPPGTTGLVEVAHGPEEGSGG